MLVKKYDLDDGSKAGLCGNTVKEKKDCCHCLKAKTKPLTAGSIVIGGDTSLGPTATVEKLGPTKERNSVMDLPSPRWGHNAFVVPNSQHIIVCGGKGKYSSPTFAKTCITHIAYSYKPWKAHSILLQPRQYATIGTCKYSGDTYMLGGWYSAKNSEVLKKGSSTWKRGPTLPEATYGACTASVSGSSFALIGGGLYHNMVRIYNVNRKSWSHPWSKLAEGRRGHSCVVVNNFIVVSGGYSYKTYQYTGFTCPIGSFQSSNPGGLMGMGDGGRWMDDGGCWKEDATT